MPAWHRPSWLRAHHGLSWKGAGDPWGGPAPRHPGAKERQWPLPGHAMDARASPSWLRARGQAWRRRGRWTRLDAQLHVQLKPSSPSPPAHPRPGAESRWAGGQVADGPGLPPPAPGSAGGARCPAPVGQGQQAVGTLLVRVLGGGLCAGGEEAPGGRGHSELGRPGPAHQTRLSPCKPDSSCRTSSAPCGPRRTHGAKCPAGRRLPRLSLQAPADSPTCQAAPPPSPPVPGCVLPGL